MSLSITVPWECACCGPACSHTSYHAFVKNLTLLEYLQIYFSEEIVASATFTTAETLTFLSDPTYSEYRAESVPTTASGSASQSPACTKSISISNYVPGGMTYTYVYRDATPDSVFTAASAVYLGAELSLNQSGASRSLYARILVNEPQGAAFPPDASTPGTTVGGDINIEIQGTTVTGGSIGTTGYGGYGGDTTYQSNSTVSVSVAVTLATPP
jgi:hypothetical protein